MSQQKEQKKYKKVSPASGQETDNSHSEVPPSQTTSTSTSPHEPPQSAPEASSTSNDDTTQPSTAPAGTIFADPNNFSIKHPLQNKWTLWYDNPGKKTSQDTWGNFLQKIVDFDTVEDFWRLYNNIIKASTLGHGANYHLFKSGVEPKWEHEANTNGGKWLITFNAKQRENLDKVWLYTMLACIGEAFGDWESEICGAVVSLRKQGDRIALWTRTARDEESCQAIGRIFKEVLELGDKAKIGYQSHSDAMRRNSSFGNRPRYEV